MIISLKLICLEFLRAKHKSIENYILKLTFRIAHKLIQMENDLKFFCLTTTICILKNIFYNTVFIIYGIVCMWKEVDFIIFLYFKVPEKQMLYNALFDNLL